MLNLAEYRQTADRLADHLPWAALVAPGVVLNKDGSFQRTLRFRGPDLESATEAELVGACARAKIHPNGGPETAWEGHKLSGRHAIARCAAARSACSKASAN